MLNDTIDEEKSTKSTSGTVIYSRVDDGENEEKPTDVFGDNVESLQRTAQKMLHQTVGHHDRSTYQAGFWFWIKAGFEDRNDMLQVAVL